MYHLPASWRSNLQASNTHRNCGVSWGNDSVLTNKTIPRTETRPKPEWRSVLESVYTSCTRLHQQQTLPGGKCLHQLHTLPAGKCLQQQHMLPAGKYLHQLHTLPAGKCLHQLQTLPAGTCLQQLQTFPAGKCLHQLHTIPATVTLSEIKI